MGVGGPEQAVAKEDGPRHRSQHVELGAEIEDLPVPQLEVTDHELLPLGLPRARMILVTECQGDRIGKAVLARHQGGHGEDGGGIAPAGKGDHAGRRFQRRPHDLLERSPNGERLVGGGR